MTKIPTTKRGKQTQVTMSLPPELVRAVKKLSEKKGMPMAACVREALEDLLQKQPKSTKREIAFWWNPEDGTIHMSAEPDFVTTVRSDPSSERGHPKLFEWLRAQLKADGRPAPAE